MFSLANKVAIVTGASRGIGSAIAHNLSRANAKIVLISRSIDVNFCRLENLNLSTSNLIRPLDCN